MRNIKALENKQVESFELRSIQADQPESFVLSVEGAGGGANLYGPLTEGEALEASALLAPDYLADDIHVRSIDQAIAEFCDED